MVRTLLLAFLCVFASLASAAETAWQELAPGVRLRMISDGAREAGQTLVAFELDMPAGYKTYWRVPGQSGIATQVDWTGSQGIGEAQIRWPYPMREKVGEYLDHVYHGPTILPVAVPLTGGAARINASVVMGICSDICVPAMAAFELNLDAQADAGNGLRIAQAMAQTPIAWNGGEDAFGTMTFDIDRGGLVVPVTDAAIDPASLIAAADDPDIVFGVPQKSPDGAAIFLPILSGDNQAGLAGRNIHLTFMTDSGAYVMEFTPHDGGWMPVFD